MGRKCIAQCTKDELLAKIIEYNGNAYRAYTELNCPYSQYLRWCEDPDFKEGVEQARKKGVQFAENKLFELIEAGNEKLIKFFLSAKGGYTTKKELVVDSKSVVDVNAAIDSIKKEIDADDN